MDYTLYLKYQKQFGCIISYVFYLSTTLLKDSDGNFYNLGGATDEEIYELVKESLSSGDNIVLKKFKDKQYVVEPLDPNCEY